MKEKTPVDADLAFVLGFVDEKREQRRQAVAKEREQYEAQAKPLQVVQTRIQAVVRRLVQQEDIVLRTLEGLPPTVLVQPQERGQPHSGAELCLYAGFRPPQGSVLAVAEVAAGHKGEGRAAEVWRCTYNPHTERFWGSASPYKPVQEMNVEAAVRSALTVLATMVDPAP